MSEFENLISRTLESGIEPLTLSYEPIKQFSSDKEYVRVTMTVNSLELGVLELDQYRFVARRSTQGDRLVKRHLEKTFLAIPEKLKENPSIAAFILPVYGRMIKNRTLHSIIFETMVKYPEVSPDKICIEISSDILYEDLDDLNEEIKSIKGLGVGLAVGEVGDPFCPLMRLSQLPFDMALVTSEIYDYLANDKEEVVGGLTKILHSMDIAVHLQKIPDDIDLALVEKLGFDGYSLENPPEELPEVDEFALPKTEAEEPAEQPAEETAEQPGEETAEQPAEETAAEETDKAEENDLETNEIADEASELDSPSESEG